MVRPGTTLRWVGWTIVLLTIACDHDPIVERRGDSIPDTDASTMPPGCEQEMATGGAGGAPEPVRFCQAEIVLRTVCQRCHQDPPLHGAPFKLVTYEDTQLPFGDNKLRWQRMREVVEQNIMPLQGIPEEPVLPLNCEQKSTLLGWLNQCALPEGGTDCEGRSEELVSCE